MESKIIVNKIIPFSNVDGPGNRMAIFLQECPFRCLYCHNPETINRCCNCLTCLKHCPAQALEVKAGQVCWDFSKCVNCDTCIKVCPHLSSPKTREYTSQELFDLVLYQRMFIQGVTISGGECMVQSAALLDFVKKCHDNDIDCLLDSNGYKDFSQYPDILDNITGVMLDVKAVDKSFHQFLVQHSNENVLKNLDYLLENNKLVEVRTVLLPNYHQENLATIKYVAEKIKDKCNYKLIKYRPYGVREEGLKLLSSNILPEAEFLFYLEYARKCGATRIISI